MPAYRTFLIDADKLSVELMKTGKSLQEISISMGYSADYLTKIVGSSDRRGRISKRAIVALKLLYDIDYDTYKHIEKAEETPDDEKTTQNESAIKSEEIYATVRIAVNDEMRMFLQHGVRRCLDDNDIKRNFDVVKCVTSGDGYIVGELYAMVGWNNGHHILREDKSGDTHEFIAHDGGFGIGELNNPDGTGQPSFTAYKYKNKAVK